MQAGELRPRTDRRRRADAYLDAYGRMLLIREFEQEMHRLFLKGEVHGTTHLSAGQEAVPVGVCMALEPGDYVAAPTAATATRWPRAPTRRRWRPRCSAARAGSAAAAPAR